MDLAIRIRIVYNVRHGYATHLKFGIKLLTFLTEYVLEGKANICSTIKENLPLHYRKFSALVAIVIM